MNYSLLILEIAVLVLGLGLLLVDLWTPPANRRFLGYGAAAALGLILLASFTLEGVQPGTAFNGMYVQDALSIFFKRFFLVAALLVTLMAVEYSDRLPSGVTEYFALIQFALLGMMVASSVANLILVFVALELITVTFYILVSFRTHRRESLEAGVKYLILGAISTCFSVYGIALVFGMANTTDFAALMESSGTLQGNPLLQLGLLLILAGVAFKIAAFPFQIWAPDVYQGAPAPTAAFLAVGSKAAGFVILMRVLFTAVPEIALQWEKLLMLVAGITILYGNLCAIPQRNVKRLLGYSSIAHAGYMLLGIAAMSASGQSAVLYYLAGYLFTVLAAFFVVCLVMKQAGAEDISSLAGLHRRSPLLAVTMTLAMISLAGIPPLAGFFGKFLLLKAVIEQGASFTPYYWLAAVALFGVLVSFYYYLGVVRVIYWSTDAPDTTPIEVPMPVRVALWVCIAGMFYLGLLPNRMVDAADTAVRVLNL
jgi:NADH-quinone oxidoreductase subunit N